MRIEKHRFTYPDGSYQDNICIQRTGSLFEKPLAKDQFILTIRNDEDMANWIFEALSNCNTMAWKPEEISCNKNDH